MGNLKAKVRQLLGQSSPQYRAIRNSGLFDPHFYVTQNPDVSRSGQDPLFHYISRGELEGRKPNPLFDIRHYRAQVSPEIGEKTNLLLHYYKTGAEQNLESHPLFHTLYYRQQCEKQGLILELNPLAHFLSTGSILTINPHPLFDYRYFMAQATRFEVDDTNALIAYIHYPELWHIDPHPLFDVSFYFSRNSQLAESGVCPLLHYLSGDNCLTADPHPLLQGEWYRQQLMESADKDQNPLVHYLLNGRYDGKTPFALKSGMDGTDQKNACVKTASCAPSIGDSAEPTLDYGQLPDVIQKLLEEELISEPSLEDDQTDISKIDLTPYMKKKRDEIFRAGQAQREKL